MPFTGTDFDGRSDYGPFIAVGIPAGACSPAPRGSRPPEEAAIWGGTAGASTTRATTSPATLRNINLFA